MNFWWPYAIPKKTRDEAARLFDAANDAARDPALYTDGGVADTLDGRFQLLGLFASLTLAQIEDKKLRQALFDRMFMTIEAALREMGVGDLSVPYKLKPMFKAFHGQAQAYQNCLQTGQWDDALQRNLFPDTPASPAQIAVIRGAVDRFTATKAMAA